MKWRRYCNLLDIQPFIDCLSGQISFCEPFNFNGVGTVNLTLAQALIERGYVNLLLAGNALATHDIERSMFGTSLGVDLAVCRSINKLQSSEDFVVDFFRVEAIKTQTGH